MGIMKNNNVACFSISAHKWVELYESREAQ